MEIPKGKTIRINKTTRGSLTSVNQNIPMILKEPFTITTSSNFKKLIGKNTTSSVLDAVGAVSNAITGVGGSSQLKQFGLQTWQNTEPLSFTATLYFYLGIANKFNAYEEVYQPTIALQSLNLPTVNNAVDSVLVPPGPTLLNLLDLTDTENSRLAKLKNFISLEIGDVYYIPQVIVKSVNVQWNNEVQEVNLPVAGEFPISSVVTVEFQSLYTATVNMIKNRSNN